MSGARTWVVLGLLGVAASGQDVVLHLHGSGAVRRESGRYQCDAAGVALGLPKGPFVVRYVQSGDTSLAIVPLNGRDLVFAGVLSASGSRYVARNLTWWEARTPMFIQDDDSKLEKDSTCRHLD